MPPTRPTERSAKTFSEYILLAAILIGNAIFLHFNAFRCFNFFDMGIFLDASWRVYQGQIPYVDFIYTSGPLHLYLNALFFSIFGFGKTAILAHLISVHSLVIIFIFSLTRRYLTTGVSVLLALLTTTSFYWPISHPWYDQSGHLFGILATGWIVLNSSVESRRISFQAALVAGILVVLSLMAKTNIGLAYGGVLLAVVLSSRNRREGFVGYALGLGVMLGIIFFLMKSPSAYCEQVIGQYGQAKINRLANLASVKAWFENYYWIAIAAVLVGIGKRWRGFLPIFLAFLGVFVVAVVSAATGSIVPKYNVFLWGFFMTLAFIVLHETRQGSPLREWDVRGKISFFILTGLTVWLIFMSGRYGPGLKVWSYMKDPPFGDYSMKTKGFEGWWCDREQGEIFDDMTKFIGENVAGHESLLVLADMVLVNAAAGRQSYPGVPFWFAAGDLPVKGKQLQQVRERILHSPPDWILFSLHGPTHGKPLLQYLEIEDMIHQQYLPVKNWKHYVLLKRKGERHPRP